MEDNSPNEPLISKNSGDFEMQKFEVEDGPKFESNDANMTIESSASEAQSSLLYKCFYPIIVILYYGLCCCLCCRNRRNNPKHLVMRRFQKWIKKRGQNKNDPLDILLKLYAGEDVVDKLEEVRLNPDFTSVVRNDLEFYLPQLCSYCLYADTYDEIKKFIIIASQNNMYFSHRVLFFLESLSSDDPGVKENIQNILLSLCQMQGTDTRKTLNQFDESRMKPELQKAIDTYKKIEMLPDETMQVQKNQMMASDIKLPKYDFTMGMKTFLSNESGYLSTPFFALSLTNLCNIILNSENKEEALFEGLQKINLHLPAAVYIPFVNNSMRNFVALHIKVMEAKVFVTKERAPFLMCLEVFRPEESQFKDKIIKLDDEYDTEESEKAEEDGDVLSTVKQNWKNFLIKHRDLKLDSVEFGSSRRRKIDLEEKRFRSVSMINNHTFKTFHDDKAKEQPKSKFDLFDKIFKSSGNKKNKLIKKIEKFADKKASHFVNLKKIKKREPYSSDFLDNIQVRSLSRTFTGKPDYVKKFQEDKIGELSPKIELMKRNITLSKIDENELSFLTGNSPNLAASTPSNQDYKNGEAENVFFSDKMTKSVSHIGDFYENIPQRTSVYIKNGHRGEEEKTHNNSMDVSSMTRNQMAQAINNIDKTLPIKNLSGSQDDDSELEEIKEVKETALQQEKRIRKESIFGHLRTWKLLRIIVKSGDDLRQEQFAMQLISQIDQIFKRKKLNIWLNPYEILATGKDCGLIEFLSDAASIDAIKKKKDCSLEDYFKEKFPRRKDLRKARDSFARSLAGYSLVCFILQIKDRHNGNILLDDEGHIMHIDFGFILTNAPGKGLNFETAPFKLTDEFVNVMDGLESSHFKRFRRKLIEGFMAIQARAEHLICLVEMMTLSQSELECFKGGRERVISELRDRLFPYYKTKLTKNECTEYVDYLIASSYNNWRTRVYDGFQKCCQGIAA